MSDLIFLAVLVGFFAVAFGLLRFCERIIGNDTVAPSASSAGAATATETAEVAA